MNKYQTYLDKIGEYGVVKEVRHPIVVISGLPQAKPHEIVIFESGEMGEVFIIDKDTTQLLVFSRDPIRAGTQVVRTDQFMSVPVGDELLGAIIDPLGESISASRPYKRPKEMREIDREVHKLASRSKITKPLWTGTTLIDMMVPLGKGQRELVIGDRKTGKSSFLLSMIKKQVEEGAIAIYCGIGRKKNDIKLLQEYFDREGISNKIVMVATTSKDSPSLIYVTPYTAMTIAEYFRDQGKDVLVVLDDLSSHARFYREVSLLAKRFPGRESYPGDIFYAHAKLVERAGNFFMEGHEGDNTKVASITCIPVVEIVESDLAAYISTNVMGMTDGHIFFDTNAYNEGKRPAVNIPLSVTRVGKQTQSKLKREITGKISAFLSSYAKMESFSHFGAELSDTVKAELTKGRNIYAFFDQHYNLSVPSEVQVILFAMIWGNLTSNMTKEELYELRIGMIDGFNKKKEVQELFNKTLEGVEKLDDLVAVVTKSTSQILSLCKTDKKSEKK